MSALLRRQTIQPYQRVTLTMAHYGGAFAVGTTFCRFSRLLRERVR
jgi:hypothetical protein